MRKVFYFFLLSCLSSVTYSQPAPPTDAADILVKLRKLNFLGSVLYVAAHPDDENTQLIAYLENDIYARTAYLSLTRGDGGQNLIGPEIRETLGVIRTQELLAARRTDGGEQFFTRAIDFGYSKNAEETLQIWDKDQVLGDVVWAFRLFKPDVIITRFPPDERAGHGHHTSSAMLAEEAFDIAHKPTEYPDHLKYTSTWQPIRLYTNTGRWWNPNMTRDEPGVLTIDVGTYNPLTGQSMTEISAISRSQHKSQGFGSTGSRGEELEFLEQRKGSSATESLFEGIDTSWKRVQGGEKIGLKIDEIISEYSPLDPAASVPALLEVRQWIAALQDEFWRNLKLKEVDQVLKDMTGLFLEAKSSEWRLYPGKELTVALEATNRSDISLTLEKIKINGTEVNPGMSLESNKEWTSELKVSIPSDAEYSHPYWLQKEGTLGMYHVAERTLIGTPENAPPLTATLYIKVNGVDIQYTIPVKYKWNDPVMGEQSRPLVVGPPAVVNIQEPVYLFSAGKSRRIDVRVTSYQTNVREKVVLQTGPGWKITPEFHEITPATVGEQTMVTFEVSPPVEQTTDELRAYVQIGEEQYSRGQVTIDYAHFPAQTMLPETTARLVNVPIKKFGERVGYIAGAGDAIPATLRELGYEVWEMNNDDVTPTNLETLDAVILGIRALNTNEKIGTFMDELLKYVERGGTLIVQYNTNSRLKTDDFAPYPLKLSRFRVANEAAPVTILAKDHPVMNEPNIILPEDFDHWVQERGLYFPGEWDDAYVPILSSNDPGEEPLHGGLLVASYGKGHYIYTGYSWFRELPAGVPGAIKLFTNLVSLGNDQPSSKRSGE